MTPDVGSRPKRDVIFKVNHVQSWIYEHQLMDLVKRGWAGCEWAWGGRGEGWKSFEIGLKGQCVVCKAEERIKRGKSG